MPSVTRHILGNSLKRFEASSCPRRRLASDRIFSSDDVRHSMRMIFSYCGFCNSVSTRATLNDEAKTILRGWQIAQMEAGGCSPWVFPSDRGDTHVNPTNFYHRVWMPSVKRAGIAWCTWHELRHTFASRLAMSGKSEGTIASLLRHSTTTLVKRYAHLSPSYLKDAIEAVSSFGKTETQRQQGQDGQVRECSSIEEPTVTPTGSAETSITQEKPK